VPPSRATRRLSSIAKARRARGSGEGGGGPGHGNKELVRFGQGLPSRLENSSTKRAKDPADRRASLRCRVGSKASCGMQKVRCGWNSVKFPWPANRGLGASHRCQH
jgi:hypothetical protein